MGYVGCRFDFLDRKRGNRVPGTPPFFAINCSNTKGNTTMSTKKPNETTSARVATIASKLLSNPSTPKNVKTVAASVLTQKLPPSGGKKK